MTVSKDDETIGVYNIVTPKGSTFRRTLTWTDENGNPINLTSATGAMSVRKITPKTYLQPYTVEVEVLVLTSGAGEIYFNSPATDGKIFLYASAADMDIEPGTYYYDLEITIGTDVDKIFRGLFDIAWEATT